MVSDDNLDLEVSDPTIGHPDDSGKIFWFPPTFNFQICPNLKPDQSFRSSSVKLTRLSEKKFLRASTFSSMRQFPEQHFTSVPMAYKLKWEEGHFLWFAWLSRNWEATGSSYLLDWSAQIWMKNEDMSLPMNRRTKASQLHCQVEYTSTDSTTKKAKWVQDSTLAEAPDVDDIDQVECLQGVHPIPRGDNKLSR